MVEENREKHGEWQVSGEKDVLQEYALDSVYWKVWLRQVRADNIDNGIEIEVWPKMGTAAFAVMTLQAAGELLEALRTLIIVASSTTGEQRGH